MPSPHPERFALTEKLMSYHVYLPSKEFEIYYHYPESTRELIFSVFLKLRFLDTVTFLPLISHDWSANAEAEARNLCAAISELQKFGILKVGQAVPEEFFCRMDEIKKAVIEIGLYKSHERQQLEECLELASTYQIQSINIFLLIAEYSVVENFDHIFLLSLGILKDESLVNEKSLQLLIKNFMALPTYQDRLSVLICLSMELLKFFEERMSKPENTMFLISLIPNPSISLVEVANLMVLLHKEKIEIEEADLRKISTYATHVKFIVQHLKASSLLSQENFSILVRNLNAVRSFSIHGVLAKLSGANPSLLTQEVFTRLFSYEGKYDFTAMSASLRRMENLDQHLLRYVMILCRRQFSASSPLANLSLLKKHIAENKADAAASTKPKPWR
jgi:hypothetical protein